MTLLSGIPKSLFLHFTHFIWLIPNLFYNVNCIVYNSIIIIICQNIICSHLSPQIQFQPTLACKKFGIFCETLKKEFIFKRVING